MGHCSGPPLSSPLAVYKLVFMFLRLFPRLLHPLCTHQPPLNSPKAQTTLDCHFQQDFFLMTQGIHEGITILNQLGGMFLAARYRIPHSKNSTSKFKGRVFHGSTSLAQASSSGMWFLPFFLLCILSLLASFSRLRPSWSQDTCSGVDVPSRAGNSWRRVVPISSYVSLSIDEELFHRCLLLAEYVTRQNHIICLFPRTV